MGPFRRSLLTIIQLILLAILRCSIAHLVLLFDKKSYKTFACNQLIYCIIFSSLQSQKTINQSIKQNLYFILYLYQNNRNSSINDKNKFLSFSYLVKYSERFQYFFFKSVLNNFLEIYFSKTRVQVFFLVLLVLILKY